MGWVSTIRVGVILMNYLRNEKTGWGRATSLERRRVPALQKRTYLHPTVYNVPNGVSMENPLKLKKINHVEFYVGNAKQSAYYYRKGFGFSQIAYKGLETGNRTESSYVSGRTRRRSF